jgi:hypothetical protein
MSDSRFDAVNDSAFEPAPNSGWDSGHATGWSANAPAAVAQSRPKASLDWHAFVEWLPRLGTQLWLHRSRADRAFPRSRLMPQGVLLLDHPALAALADCSQIVACSDIAAHGPREWLEFRTVREESVARLYLLPDTDYLAWDGMLGACAIERDESRPAPRWQAHTAFLCSALSRLRSPRWQAYVTRFPLLRLPALQVLGMRLPDSLSALGVQIVAAITADECATLRVAHDSI